ncbi:UNVERIFIED_CONTAM: hypothetical protein FKN15_008670 [Acipenser sinensis]
MPQGVTLQNCRNNFLLTNGQDTNELKKLLELLCRSVYKVNKWWPRITQMVSWCLLALTNSGKLLEVATREGKSSIIAMFAVFHVLKGEKIDIVSSSSVLSERDAKDWKDFYSLFNITVDTNTDKSEDEDQNRCYGSDIVYRTAQTFFADYLRQNFEMKRIFPQPRFQCIIVDEVDSLLLDRGLQFTYLSSDMPGMQHLGPILAMIWCSALCEGTDIEDPLQIQEIAEQKGLVPLGATEYVLSGKQVLKNILKSVDPENMLNIVREAEEYFPYKWLPYTLDDKVLIVEDGLCCALYDADEDYSETVAENVKKHIQYIPFDENKSDALRVPGFLKDLVETKLQTWVENAFLAVKLKEGREYLVQGKQVLPVDFKSTGIVEMNKKWGDGLQQFLEMKHLTKVSTLSTITNYISNVRYFSMYNGQIYGTTGTLGTESDLGFLHKLYPTLSVCRVPTFNRKKLFEVKGLIRSTKEEWQKTAVVQKKVKASSYGKGQAALVICEDINKANDLYDLIKDQAPGQVTQYIRNDSRNGNISDRVLKPGDVIVATNLAGRGTDTKVSEEVVCLWFSLFFPKMQELNCRLLEEQLAKGSLAQLRRIQLGVLGYFQSNLYSSIKKLKAIKAKDGDAMTDESGVFSLGLQDDPDVQEELYELYKLGLLNVFSVKEKPCFCWEGLLAFLLGVVQIVAGVLLAVLTAGSLSTIGMAMITEGISDCIDRVTAMVTGEFSWESWAISKAISIGLSLISSGIGTLLSKGFKGVKAATNAFVKNVKSLPKMLPSEARSGFTVAMKEHAKQALKKAGKEVVQQTVMFGIGQGEEMIMDVIIEEIKSHVQIKTKEHMREKVQKEPLRSAVDGLVLSQLTNPKELKECLNPGNPLCDSVKGLFGDFIHEILNEDYRSLEQQNQLFGAITGLIDKSKAEVQGRKKTILNIIKITYLSTLAGLAINDVTNLLNNFVSKLSANINSFMHEKRIQSLNACDLSEEDKLHLKPFRESLTDSISEELGTLLVHTFHQKFSGHLVKAAQSQINQYASNFVSNKLNTNRTVEKLKGSSAPLYVSDMAFATASKKKMHPADQVYLDKYIENIKQSNTAGSVLDLKMLSETTGTKVIVSEENKKGKLQTKHVLEPSSGSVHNRVHLVYQPASKKYPEGH